MLASIYAKIMPLVDETWQDDMRQFGDDVRLYREYEAGDHRAKMTPVMREMLRIDDARTEHFNDNYCELVVNKFVNRLSVTRIEGESDEATAWTEEIMRLNRFDSLQYDVHEATIRDGDTFVFVDFDNDGKFVRLHHEPAWDGEIGMMVIYDRMVRNIVLAIKVWHEGNDKRVNFYYEDRIEKYLYKDDLLNSIEVTSWTFNGAPLGVPVVHFRNKSKSRRVRGRSELKSAIPMQDALNRTLVSMVTTSELSAFALRYAIGFDPPANLAPGSWVVVASEGAGSDERLELGTMQQAALVPFISQAQFLIEQIATVSATPLMTMMGGAGESGEALKQRENDLIGKVEMFQVKNGNAWEDVFTFAQALQRAFGTTMPPETRIWSCKWKPAELRDESQVIANAKMVRDEVSHREFLRLIAPAFDYDDGKIDTIVAERIAEQAESVNALQGVLPGFDQFVSPAP